MKVRKPGGGDPIEVPEGFGIALVGCGWEVVEPPVDPPAREVATPLVPVEIKPEGALGEDVS